MAACKEAISRNLTANLMAAGLQASGFSWVFVNNPVFGDLKEDRLNIRFADIERRFARIPKLYEQR
jgi:hypothetical protein